MGFGLLLYGYLMLITAGNAHIDFFPDLLGYILFFIALKKLTPYSPRSKGFVIAKTVCYPLFLIGTATLVGQVLGQFSIGGALVGDILIYAELAKNVLLLFFHIYMLLGIAELSNDVELPKLAFRARIGIALSVVMYGSGIILQSFEELAPTLVQNNAPIYSFAGLFWQIMFFVVFFYNLYLIFSCYRHICYEGEDDIATPDNPIEKFFKKLSGKKDDL